jgi:chromosome segregation ATPase
LTARNIEFDKLLTENGQLISEIDLAQDKVEAQDYEISLLKAELEEIRTQSVGKSDYFKETLANRNFEITNLEANNAALAKEVQMLKDEVLGLSQNLQESASGSEELQNLRSRLDERNLELEQLRVQNASLEAKIHELSAENEQFSAEIGYFHDMVAGLNEHVAELNLVISKNEADLQSASASVNTEHEAFVDRLFKQIDELNDQRLALLDEKEQMANQLLKMNEVVGSISQQVESERIDVTGLNNHRKNVILANNSGAPAGQSPMKEQINDLVREIDKCIALLSA